MRWLLIPRSGQRSSRIKHFSAADSQFSLKYECVLIAGMYTFQLAFQSDMEISHIQVVCYDTPVLSKTFKTKCKISLKQRDVVKLSHFHTGQWLTSVAVYILYGKIKITSLNHAF